MEEKLEEIKFLLKCLRVKEINWKIAEERREFLSQLYPFIKEWDSPYPDLGNFLTPEKMERLLFDSTTSKDLSDVKGKKFVEFVALSGYKLKPDVDEDGKPMLRRTTPVHEAAKNGISLQDEIIFDLCEIYDHVNYISEDGYTHFHAACQYNHDDELDVVQKFLELGQVDPNCILPKTGDSPLHLTLMEGPNHLAALLLLRHGADPNLANGKGLTPLHRICSSPVDEDFLELFFEVGAANSDRPLEIDVLDDLHRTPLHLALAHGHMVASEFLLRRGADPNRANAAGETALHAVCKFPSHVPPAWYYNEYDLTLMLFEFSHDRYKPLRVDARNDEGITPLQLAVANHMPDALEVLLEHGADLADFVYPAANYVDDDLEWIIDVKSRELLGALLCTDRLAKRGYELTWSNALEIMKLFARYEFFEKSDVDLQRSLLDNEGFASRAKSLTVKKDLLLHDLIQLQRPEEVHKRLTYQDMFDFVNQDISRFEFDKVGAKEACPVYLCEIMSRRFFQSWALYPFWKLIHYQLPLEMCEVILANLKNEDLYHICLAATQDQSRDDSKKDVTASVTKCDNNKRPRESKDQVAPKRAKIPCEEKTFL